MELGEKWKKRNRCYRKPIEEIGDEIEFSLI